MLMLKFGEKNCWRILVRAANETLFNVKVRRFHSLFSLVVLFILSHIWCAKVGVECSNLNGLALHMFTTQPKKPHVYLSNENLIMLNDEVFTSISHSIFSIVLDYTPARERNITLNKYECLMRSELGRVFGSLSLVLTSPINISRLKFSLTQRRQEWGVKRGRERIECLQD